MFRLLVVVGLLQDGICLYCQTAFLLCFYIYMPLGLFPSAYRISCHINTDYPTKTSYHTWFFLRRCVFLFALGGVNCHHLLLVLLLSCSFSRFLRTTGEAMRGSLYPQQWHGGDAVGLNSNMAAMLQQLQQQQQQQQFLQQRRLHQQQVVSFALFFFFLSLFRWMPIR